MKSSPFNGLWALVTGASSGMGRDYAKLLAAQGCRLVLTARREPALEALAGELRERHGAEVVVKAGDLSQSAFRERLIAKKALTRNTPSVIPGLLNKLTVLSLRLIPRRLQVSLAYQLMRND